ncbi:MAG: hypothetical protein MMC33_000420 [Icmadophila ericetorum]|nr:hypothetical protein [Icmadophila ericetorum]
MCHGLLSHGIHNAEYHAQMYVRLLFELQKWSPTMMDNTIVHAGLILWSIRNNLTLNAQIGMGLRPSTLNFWAKASLATRQWMSMLTLDHDPNVTNLPYRKGFQLSPQQWFEECLAHHGDISNYGREHPMKSFAIIDLGRDGQKASVTWGKGQENTLEEEFGQVEETLSVKAKDKLTSKPSPKRSDHTANRSTSHAEEHVNEVSSVKHEKADKASPAKNGHTDENSMVDKKLIANEKTIADNPRSSDKVSISSKAA